MPFHKKAIGHLFTLRIIEGPLAIREKNKRTNAQKLKPNGGFTLIEILVVVGIMAVLAGAILYSTSNARDKGKDARRKTDLLAVASALSAYFADNHHYPPTDLAANNSLDYVSYPYSASWIPDLSSYMNGNKLPKDPLQTHINTQLASTIKNLMTSPQNQKTANRGQVAGTTTLTIASGPDDTKRGSTDWSATHTDVPVGKPFQCDNNYRASSFRFTNVQIPKGSTINSGDAIISFYPRNNTHAPDPDDSEINNLDTVNATFYAEAADNSAQITNISDFGARPRTFSTVAWNAIPHWSVGNRYQKDISPIINEIVNRPGWQEGNALTIFWEDNASTGPGPGGDTNPPYCAGRIPLSYEGAVATADPTDSPPSITITLTSPPIPPIPTTTGACNGSFPTNVYCYRTSANEKVFVLWTKLENANDPNLSTNPNALCKEADVDFDPNNPANASPFKGLGLPTGSFFNYCIKSPQ